MILLGNPKILMQKHLDEKNTLKIFNFIIKLDKNLENIPDKSIYCTLVQSTTLGVPSTTLGVHENITYYYLCLTGSLTYIFNKILSLNMISIENIWCVDNIVEYLICEKIELNSSGELIVNGVHFKNFSFLDFENIMKIFNT